MSAVLFTSTPVAHHVVRVKFTHSKLLSEVGGRTLGGAQSKYVTPRCVNGNAQAEPLTGPWIVSCAQSANRMSFGINSMQTSGHALAGWLNLGRKHGELLAVSEGIKLHTNDSVLGVRLKLNVQSLGVVRELERGDQ